MKTSITTMKRTKLLFLCALLWLGEAGALLAQNIGSINNPYNVTRVVQVMRRPTAAINTIIAHRGFWGNGVPENSLAAIRRAVENGIEAVELDIKMSKDGQPFLMHDTYLRRTTSVDNGDRVWDWYMKDLKKYAYLVDQNNNRNGEKVSSLNDALDYIKSNKLAVVLTLDIKDVAAAKACWEVVKRKSNWWGTPAYDWVIFKLNANIFNTPKELEDALFLWDRNINTWREWREHFKLMPVFTTAMATQFNCWSRYFDFSNKPYFIVAEINAKQTNGNLWPLAQSWNRRDSRGTACFNPVPDAGGENTFTCGLNGATTYCGSGANGCYWVDGGWCKYTLSQVYSSGDTDDRRWDRGFLSTFCNVYTTDAPIGLHNYLANRLVRNTNAYFGPNVRMEREAEAPLEESYSDAMKVFPNPTQDQLTVNLFQKMAGAVTFKLVSMLGETQFTEEQQVEEGQHDVVLPLKTKGINSGVYMLEVTPTGMAGKTFKIVMN